ncbi:armadillo-type protein [Tribonema minus]|uniref:Armadillo-type protein n=1 Tax=Tribonema minus TaxID=303371 RepID=A0A835YMS8_9STRA|nr:armadillo-type protein [Tribonema minus]
MSADLAHCHAAIQALYGSDPTSSRAANTYLMDIAQQPVAWNLGLSLLSNFPSDTNANFFGANLLYSKVTRNWHQLDAQERVQLSDAILQLVRGTGPHGGLPFPTITMTKLCLSLAAVAVRSRGGPSVYVGQAFALAQAGGGGDGDPGTLARLALMMVSGQPARMDAIAQKKHMLVALTDEADTVDVSRALRLEVEDGLMEASPHVMQAVEHAMNVAVTGSWTPPQRADLLVAALKCLNAWVEMGISLSNFATRHEGLFSLLLRVLKAMPELPGGGGVTPASLLVARASCLALQGLLLIAEYPRPPALTHVFPSEARVRLAVDAVLDALTAALATTEARPPAPSLNAMVTPAVDAVLDALTGLPRAFAATLDAGDGDTCSAICQAAVDVAEREVACVAGAHATPAGLALVEFLLGVTGCASRQMALLTLEFWLTLQDSPVAERHPSMAHDVYVRLLEVLLQQAEYPAGFTSWETAVAIDSPGASASAATEHDAVDFDEDEFKAFRDDAHGIKDVLVVVYYLLRAQYLERVLQRLQQRQSSWQAVEACLLAVTHVAKEVRSWISSPEKTAEGSADAQRSRDLLQGLIQELVLNSAISSHPLVLAAGCRLVGAFSSLLTHRASTAPQDNPLLVPALRYLCTGLRDATSRAAAAAALRGACAACERAVAASDAAVEVLLPQLQAVNAPVEQQVEVAEAGARVLAALEPARASQLIALFAAPLLQDVKQVTEVLTQIVRFLDAPPAAAAAAAADGGGGSGAHACAELLQSLRPLVDAVAGRCQGSEEVMAQLFLLVGKALSSLRSLPALQAHIPAFLNIMLDHYPCCLECMGTAVEVYSGESAQVVEHFGQLLARVCAETFTYFQGRHPGAEPQLVAAFFTLAYRYLLFAPAALLQGRDLATILDLAVACLDVGGGGSGTTQERESARAVAIFVGHLAQRCSGKLDAYSQQIDAVLVDRGGALVRLILVGLARAAPSMLWPNLIDCLHAILHQYLKGAHKAACQTWVQAPVCDPSLTEALAPDDRQQVMQAILRLAVQNRQQFKALMLDFAKICHHEMTTDGLLAYYIVPPSAGTITIE